MSAGVTVARSASASPCRSCSRAPAAWSAKKEYDIYIYRIYIEYIVRYDIAINDPKYDRNILQDIPQYDCRYVPIKESFGTYFRIMDKFSPGGL